MFLILQRSQYLFAFLWSVSCHHVDTLPFFSGVGRKAWQWLHSLGSVLLGAGDGLLLLSLSFPLPFLLSLLIFFFFLLYPWDSTDFGSSCRVALLTDVTWSAFPEIRKTKHKMWATHAKHLIFSLLWYLCSWFRLINILKLIEWLLQRSEKLSTSKVYKRVIDPMVSPRDGSPRCSEGKKLTCCSLKTFIDTFTMRISELQWLGILESSIPAGHLIESCLLLLQMAEKYEGNNYIVGFLLCLTASAESSWDVKMCSISAVLRICVKAEKNQGMMATCFH